MGKQCECSNCSALNTHIKSLNTISSVKEKLYENNESSANSKHCITKKCKNKISSDTSVLCNDYLLKINGSPKSNSSGNGTCENETVMTRLMRKRKKLFENDQFRLSNKIKCARISNSDRRSTENTILCCDTKFPETQSYKCITDEAIEIEVEENDSKTTESNKMALKTEKDFSHAEVKTITFEEWQKEASNKWAAYTSSECDCSGWQNGTVWSYSSDNQKTGTGCSQERHNASSYAANKKSIPSSRKNNEFKERISSHQSDESINFTVSPLEEEWSEPKNVRYREISGWPHLNDCIQTLEVLNIGGTNVLGEFIPFILLYAPRLKSLGQWINTMIYGKFCQSTHYYISAYC